MAKSNQPAPTYVPARWLMQRYAIGYTKLWRDQKAGRIPAPRYLPGGQRRWLLAELLAWEEKTLGAPGVKP